MIFFFPRLFLWLFIGSMGLLVWSTFRALGSLRWKLIFVLAVVLVAALAAIGPTDSFPFRAPGQEVTYYDASADKERILPIKPLSLNVLGLEVRPGALDNWIDARVDWMVKEWRSYFQSLRNGLLKALVPLEKGLQSMPWWLFIASSILIAWKVSGYRIALITLGGLTSIGVFGLWDNAMRTMAVVGTATAMSVGLAIPVGILMSKSDRLQGAMRPILDLMQVMPSFVYLIPAIYFLGLGKVPAVMATMIYAVPPAMRLTNLGIRLVSPELIEAAKAFGTTPWQLLIKIQLPLARPTIMAGVNQTIMMSLAMVVVASMVGATGLGADVLAGISQLEFGRGLLGGIGIVILAIIIDRTSQGLAKDPRSERGS
jgi:ABC-type proline/glycine betaine transport system permease subunit